MRRRREDRFVEHIFPVTGEFLPRRDARRDGAMSSAGAADHDALTDLHFARPPERQRRELDVRERLHEAEARLLVIAEHMSRRRLTVAEGEPDLLGFGDQVSDGEDDATLTDDDAIA